jgi:hypothetical protein
MMNPFILLFIVALGMQNHTNICALSYIFVKSLFLQKSLITLKILVGLNWNYVFLLLMVLQISVPNITDLAYTV